MLIQHSYFFFPPPEETCTSQRETQRDAPTGYGHAAAPSPLPLHSARILGVQAHTTMFLKSLGPGLDPRSAMWDSTPLTTGLWASLYTLEFLIIESKLCLHLLHL